LIIDTYYIYIIVLWTSKSLNNCTDRAHFAITSAYWCDHHHTSCLHAEQAIKWTDDNRM